MTSEWHVLSTWWLQLHSLSSGWCLCRGVRIGVDLLPFIWNTSITWASCMLISQSLCWLHLHFDQLSTQHRMPGTIRGRQFMTHEFNLIQLEWWEYADQFWSAEKIQIENKSLRTMSHQPHYCGFNTSILIMGTISLIIAQAVCVMSRCKLTNNLSKFCSAVHPSSCSIVDTGAHPLVM